MTIEREKRPLAWAMRWGLMALAAIALIATFAWVVAVAV